MSSESTAAHPNAFTRDFLRRLDEEGEPDGAHEADVAGPWVIRPVPYRGGTGFALLREWETAEGDDGADGDGGDVPDVPYAIFRRRDTALLAAAVLPATGRERLCRLGSEPEPEGFPVQLAAVSEAGVPPLAPPSSRSLTAVPSARSPLAAPAGHLQNFDEDLAAALHLVEALVRSPLALARLIEAAGYVAIEKAGRILHRSLP
jgi:hypothetical protein